jgi:ubiquinone/menaquinone biosynthesis C-methylase UbiE
MHFLDKSRDYQNPAFASVFDELPLWASYFGQLLMKHFPLAPNLNVLDIGCGNGFPSYELAHVLGDSCQITGVDIWTQALDRARAKNEVYGLSNISFVETDAGAMPFEDKSYDVIVSNLGINNFSEPDKVLRECNRVLKENGKLIFTTNLQGHYAEFYDVFREILTQQNLPDALIKLEANIKHRQSETQLKKLVENNSFEIQKLILDEFQWRYLNGTALFNHSLTRFGFLAGWQSVVPEDKQYTVFDSLEKRLNQIASKQGELTMTIPMAYIEATKKAPASADAQEM